MAGDDRPDVLSCTETESYIENLAFFQLDQIGSIRWFKQHEMLEKLNLQALCEVKMHKEEIVCERFIFFQKAQLLVEILTAQIIWTEKVFANVLKFMKQTSQTFPTYMVLFHTVSVASLLETLTYSETFCQALDDSTLDLLDFCHAAIGDQIVRKQERPTETDTRQGSRSSRNPDSAVEQLARQKDDISTILSTKAIGILCHLTQHASSLSLSVPTRMCDHHDSPVFLAGLLENNPWTVEETQRTTKFIDGEWRDIAYDDRFVLTQTEGQLWICLHQSLLNPDFTRKYYLNEFRKSRLLKVTLLLNEVLLDQLPVLADLQRYLHTLTFIDAPMPKKGIILEQSPAIRDRVLAGNRMSWDELAHRHIDILAANQGLLKTIAGRMASIYTTDNLQQVLPQPAKCACCGYPAKNRCSGCQMEWYCRRECQVKQWNKHKHACSRLKEVTSVNTAPLTWPIFNVPGHTA